MATAPRRTPIRIGSQIELGAPLGVNTMFWGDTWFDSLFGPIIPAHDLAALTRLALASNVTLFHTTEGYGGGTSEARLGNALKGCHAGGQGGGDGESGGDGGGGSGAKPVVMTKFLPTAWRWTSWSFFRALEGSRQRLGRPIDIFYIHTPVHPCLELWVECACRARKEGLIKASGSRTVARSRWTPRWTSQRSTDKPSPPTRCCSPCCPTTPHPCAVWNKHVTATTSPSSPTPTACWVRTSSPTTSRESSSSSVLAMRMTGVTYDELTPLRAEIAALALKYQVTMAQMCLNWAVEKGAVPVIGMKNEKHLHDALGCLTFTLTHDEVQSLDAKALSKATLEKPGMRRAVVVVLLSVVVLVCRVAAWVPRAWYLHQPLDVRKIKT